MMAMPTPIALLTAFSRRLHDGFRHPIRTCRATGHWSDDGELRHQRSAAHSNITDERSVTEPTTTDPDGRPAGDQSMFHQLVVERTRRPLVELVQPGHAAA